MTYTTTPTYRRGRAYYYATGDKAGLGGFCSILVICIFLILPVAFLVYTEVNHYNMVSALTEVMGNDVLPLSKDNVAGDIVHAYAHVPGMGFTEGPLAKDDDMGVGVPGALALKRNTEYCQWQEHITERCEKCSRTVRAKDGSEATETYNCNCVNQYHYVKSWQPRLIHSMLFDQPAAHHNPQRDPLPSRKFTIGTSMRDVLWSGGVEMNRVPFVLEGALVSNLRAGWRKIDWVVGGIPQPSWWRNMFARWFPDVTRYEEVGQLSGTELSHAAQRDNFVYVGQGGYFYSPFVSSNFENMLKYFLQYLEGSLFDWQFGDLMPSCTAGDIRISYQVQDPEDVSIVARVETIGNKNIARLAPIHTSMGTSLSLLYAGERSTTEMIEAEAERSRSSTYVPRALLLLWSLVASKLLGAYWGIAWGKSSWVVWLSAALGVGLSVLGMVWAWCWGFGTRDAVLSSIGGVGLILNAKSHGLQANVPGSFNAMWCMLARWAGAPPHWRVEESYTGVEKATGQESAKYDAKKISKPEKKKC